jgi:hypothetical protein
MSHLGGAPEVKTTWAARNGGFQAEVLLDSVSLPGARLTTMQWRYPRFIHAEVMTYRMFSRNTSSSRAIPLKTMIRQVIKEPAGPVYWGRNTRGMQAKEELTGFRLWLAKQLWYKPRYVIVLVALCMAWLPLHKQVGNRLLEPWMWITAIITASPVAWENCWRQRVHPDAQPEFQCIATLAQACYNSSVPTVRTVHAPLIRDEDSDDLLVYASEGGVPPTDVVQSVSVARCARASYLTHRGVRDLREDMRLYRDLRVASPPHTSPFEHSATAHEDPAYRSGNFFGWVQHREQVDPHFIHWIEAPHAGS